MYLCVYAQSTYKTLDVMKCTHTTQQTKIHNTTQHTDVLDRPMSLSNTLTPKQVCRPKYTTQHTYELTQTDVMMEYTHKSTHTKKSI